MKKANSTLIIVLFAICTFIPICSIIAFILGYRFEVRYYPVSAFIAVVFLASIVFLAANKKSGIHKVPMVFAIIMPFLIAFNWIFLLVKSADILVAVLMLFCFLCSAYLLYIFTTSKELRITSAIVSVMIVFPLCFISFFVIIFGNFGAKTVVTSVESPNGTYRADLIDDDQGALGGSTNVKVYDLHGNYDFYLFGFYKKPQTVYFGDWGEAYDMELYWINDSCLSINGQVIEVDKQ